MRYSPIAEPSLSQQVGVAATAQLDFPREFVAKVGDTLHEQTARLIKSGRWPARFLSKQPWEPKPRA
jgi:hypothetical protein